MVVMDNSFSNMNVAQMMVLRSSWRLIGDMQRLGLAIASGFERRVSMPGYVGIGYVKSRHP